MRGLQEALDDASMQRSTHFVPCAVVKLLKTFVLKIKKLIKLIALN